MSHFNKRTEQFEDECDFPIDSNADYERRLAYAAEEEGAARGLIIGCSIGLVVWGSVLSAWLLPWTRRPLASVAAVFVILIVVYATHCIVDRWRRENPDNPIVEALRRHGL